MEEIKILLAAGEDVVEDVTRSELHWIEAMLAGPEPLEV